MNNRRLPLDRLYPIEFITEVGGPDEFRWLLTLPSEERPSSPDNLAYHLQALVNEGTKILAPDKPKIIRCFDQSDSPFLNICVPGRYNLVYYTKGKQYKDINTWICAYVDGSKPISLSDPEVRQLALRLLRQISLCLDVKYITETYNRLFKL